MGNRVQNYLSDLAYALDYAYTTKCCTKPTICDGQAQRLQYVTGNAVNINGHSTVIACYNDGTGLHCDDLITAVLNLRNPQNQTNVIAKCMRNTVCAYNCDGQLIKGSIVQRNSGQAKVPGTNVCAACGCYTACGVTGTAGQNATHNCGTLTVSLPNGYYEGASVCISGSCNRNSGQAKVPGTNVCAACGCYTACGVTGTAGQNATHNCGTLTVSLPNGYYEGASVCISGSCNRTTPPTYGTCVMVDGASQYPYSSGYLVASGDGTVMSASNTYYARHNYGDVAIKIPEGYYPNNYTTYMKGAELRTPSNVAATSGKQGYVCIPAGYTSGFTCCWNMTGTSTISEANVASGCTYVDATGKLRTGTYVNPYNCKVSWTCRVTENSTPSNNTWYTWYTNGKCMLFAVSCNSCGGIDHPVFSTCFAQGVARIRVQTSSNCVGFCYMLTGNSTWTNCSRSTCNGEFYIWLPPDTTVSGWGGTYSMVRFG